MVNTEWQQHLIQCTEHEGSQQTTCTDEAGDTLQSTCDIRPYIIECDCQWNRSKSDHNNNEFCTCEESEHCRQLCINEFVVQSCSNQTGYNTGEDSHVV